MMSVQRTGKVTSLNSAKSTDATVLPKPIELEVLSLRAINRTLHKYPATSQLRCYKDLNMAIVIEGLCILANLYSTYFQLLCPPISPLARGLRARKHQPVHHLIENVVLNLSVPWRVSLLLYCSTTLQIDRMPERCGLYYQYRGTPQARLACYCSWPP